jgi:hypothetical protein
MAGVDTNQMQTFRQQGGKVAQAGDYTASIVLTNSSTNYLYQAYVGPVAASSSNTLSIFVDDNAITAGTVNTQAGDVNRTWYDGVSFAAVSSYPLRITGLTPNGASHSVKLTWSSLPASATLLPQKFTVQKKSSLSDSNWTVLASGISSAGSATSFTDISFTNGSAFYRVTMP